jgi:urease gamma subunit
MSKTQSEDKQNTNNAGNRKDQGLKFSNPEAFPFLSAFIIPLGVMVNIYIYI